MDANTSGMSEQFALASSELAELRQFPGAPKEFWPRFLGAVAKRVSADIAVLLLGHPGKTPRWTKIGEFTKGCGSFLQWRARR